MRCPTEVCGSVIAVIAIIVRGLVLSARRFPVEGFTHKTINPRAGAPVQMNPQVLPLNKV
jgi:hypothetical protein